MKFFDVLCYTLKNNHGIIGSLITGGAIIGSSLISGKSGRDAQAEANKLNRELYYADREWNKPVNQVARLREAGLNPNLVYGNGGSVAGNTSKGAPRMESIGGYDVDFAGAINAALTVGAIKKQDKETANLEKQNQSLTENINKLKEEVRGLKLDNDLKKHDLSVVRNTPTTSKDRSTGAQIIRGVNWVRGKVAQKASVQDLKQAASNLVIPKEMQGSKGFTNYPRRPWFWKSFK